MIRSTPTFVFGLGVRLHVLVEVVLVVLPLLRLFLRETEDTVVSSGHMGSPRKGSRKSAPNPPLGGGMITYCPHARLLQDVLQVVLCVCGERGRSEDEVCEGHEG